MSDPAEKPLIPRSIAGGSVATTVVAGIMAALGWAGSELISLEKAVSQGDERIAQSIERVGDEIQDIKGDVDDLRRRVIILEDHQRTRLDREASSSH